jgi:hypothetical protein
MLLQNILKCDYWDQRNKNVLLSPKSVEQESLSPLQNVLVDENCS